MSIKLKPLSESISFSAANTVGNGAVIVLTTTAQTLVTVAYANTVVKGSFVAPANYVFTLYKSATDTITANVAVFATKGTAG